MSLLEAAEKAVKQSFAIKENEKCVLVTDKENEEITNAMAKYMKEVGAQVNVYYLIEDARPYREAPELFKAMMEKADFMTYLIKDVHGEKPFRGEMVQHGEKYGRICMMPGVTQEMFERLISIDYNELKEFTQKVTNYVTDAENPRIKYESSTNLWFPMRLVS